MTDNIAELTDYLLDDDKSSIKIRDGSHLIEIFGNPPAWIRDRGSLTVNLNEDNSAPSGIKILHPTDSYGYIYFGNSGEIEARTRTCRMTISSDGNVEFGDVE